jgi:hypothetical protein
MGNAADPILPRDSQHTNTFDGEKFKAKTEVKAPVLLQWKDREMADDLAKLVMSGKDHGSGKKRSARARFTAREAGTARAA